MAPKVLLTSLGAGIRRRRKQAHLTIAQLGKLAGVDAGFLACIETAKKAPSLATTARLSAALRVSLAELFQDAPEKEPRVEYKLQRNFNFLVHDRNPSEKADLLELLKKLRDPKKVKALRRLLGR